MARDIAINITGVSKYYKLYTSPKERFKEALHPFNKRFHRKFYALRDIHLEIYTGEVFGVIGKNGSGKSTLLKVIAGVLEPNSGSLSIQGSISAMLELGVGFNPKFTGLQNIYFYGTLLGFSREKIEAKLESILGFAEIGDFIHQPLHTYSDGMKARLGFAVAINVEADILIVDEVLAVGDELFKRKCYARINQLMEEGKTIVFVTHNLGVVNQLCHRTMLLDAGDLLLEGTSKLVTMQYQRLLLSKSQSAAAIRQDILDIQHDTVRKQKLQEDLTGEGSTRMDSNNHFGARIAPNGPPPGQKPFYVPGFVPKSTCEHQDYGVAIVEQAIVTPQREKVNMLVMNEEYLYTFTVKFRIPVRSICFALAFKTQQGLAISYSGGLHNLQQHLAQVDAGEKVRVDYRFVCALLPGTYFIDVGVIGFHQNQHVYLSRLSDASVFKVQDIPECFYRGIVPLGQQVTVHRSAGST